jgi:hypothetical protein
MVRVTIDQGLEARLLDAPMPIELCDRGGRVVGHFIPVAKPARYQGVESPTPEHELERRSREEVGRPLADVLHEFRAAP